MKNKNLTKCICGSNDINIGSKFFLKRTLKEIKKAECKACGRLVIGRDKEEVIIMWNGAVKELLKDE
jgi:hypothetical protein